MCWAVAGAGKAEQWVSRNFPGRFFLATLEVRGDREMGRRIDLYRRSREEGWRILEAPLDLVGALVGHDRHGRVFLVDCLTLWLTNILLRDFSGQELEDAVVRLASTVTGRAGSVVLVVNEVGLGIVLNPPWVAGSASWSAGRISSWQRSAGSLFLWWPGCPCL